MNDLVNGIRGAIAASIFAHDMEPQEIRVTREQLQQLKAHRDAFTFLSTDRDDGGYLFEGIPVIVVTGAPTYDG